MRRMIYPLAFAVIFLLGWSLGVKLFHVPQYLLPSPWQIGRAMLVDKDYFILHGLTTLLEAFLGFALAVLLGFLLGTVFALFGLIEKMVLPYAIVACSQNSDPCGMRV
jgi:NitT/TauT family transport system permease protein